MRGRSWAGLIMMGRLGRGSVGDEGEDIGSWRKMP